MLLNLYRRHGSHCVGGRVFQDTTYEADELRRSWEELCVSDLRVWNPRHGIQAQEHGTYHLGRSQGGCACVGARRFVGWSEWEWRRMRNAKR
jgi:hypothetical protein